METCPSADPSALLVQLPPTDLEPTVASVCPCPPRGGGQGQVAPGSPPGSRAAGLRVSPGGLWKSGTPGSAGRIRANSERHSSLRPHPN